MNNKILRYDGPTIPVDILSIFSLWTDKIGENSNLQCVERYLQANTQ